MIVHAALQALAVFDIRSCPRAKDPRLDDKGTNRVVQCLVAARQLLAPMGTLAPAWCC